MAGKLSTKQILQLDYREQESKKIIQKVLRQIKPLAKCPDGNIPLIKLERCMKAISTKYGLFIRRLSPDIYAGEKTVIWRCEAFDLKHKKDMEIVYGQELYEVIAKTVIMLYSYTRKQDGNN